MRPYLAIFECRLATLFQYRAAAFAGLFTQIFWGIVKVMILQAFYSQGAAFAPITFMQAVTFVWLGQALISLQPWNIEREMEAQVRSGGVAYELVRPLDLYSLWFCRSMALRSIPTLMRGIPLFLIAGLFFDLPMPVSWGAASLFGVSLCFSVILTSAITTLVVISLFWTVSGEGVQRLMPHLTLVLSGMVVPLPFFPDWMQPFISLQPFRGIIDIPIRLYNGFIPVNEALYYLIFQLAWGLIFILIGRCLMQKALKRVVIQGG